MGVSGPLHRCAASPLAVSTNGASLVLVVHRRESEIHVVVPLGVVPDLLADPPGLPREAAADRKMSRNIAGPAVDTRGNKSIGCPSFLAWSSHVHRSVMLPGERPDPMSELDRRPARAWREPTSVALDLDRIRLMSVMPVVGQNRLALKLGLKSGRKKLGVENRRLGNYLATCTGPQRSAVGRALIAADQALPDEIRATAGCPIAPLAARMDETGCVGLGRRLSEEQIADIHAYLKPRPVLLGHDAHVARNRVGSLAEVPANANYACYDYLDLWASPHILELAASDEVLDLAQGYLRCTPTLYSINAFWSFPDRQPHKASQVFHRDWEDYRSFVVFTLLTPVDTPEEGAHCYVEGSHEWSHFKTELSQVGVSEHDARNLLERDEKAIAPTAMKLFGQSTHNFMGPAGTAFCADGFGLHRAVVPASRPRLLLWCRFGNFFNETMYNMTFRSGNRAVVHRLLERISATPRHRYIFRYAIEKLTEIARQCSSRTA